MLRPCSYIHEWFKSGKDGMDRLDAVCLIVKNSDTRLNAQTTHELREIVSLFGKNLAKNVVPLITFWDGSEPPVLNCLLENNLFKHFYNPAATDEIQAGQGQRAVGASHSMTSHLPPC